MSRWEPDARGRLQQAAIELYTSRGFEQTTVAEIAERAGLTERTFFRHFSDKREVLFGRSNALLELFVESTQTAPADASPMESVTAALMAAADMFESRRPWSTQRQKVIVANPSLQERELIKMAGLGIAMAAVLRARGVPEPEASLTAEAGIAVFRVTFERWVADDNVLPFAEIVADSLAALKTVVADAADATARQQ